MLCLTCLHSIVKISHPLVVAFHGAMQDESNVYYLLAYYPGGDLAFHLGKHGALKTSAVRFFAAEVLLAVQVRDQQWYSDTK